MAKVLFVKANDRASEQAVSVQMYDTFLKAYREAHPADEIAELDLYKENIPYFGSNTITGNYKAAQGYDLTEEEQKAVAVASKYLDQFLASDKVVIAFPLWNYVAPAPLISYVSYLSQAGKTFKYTSEGPVGLAGDKKVVLLNARGGVYSEGPMAAVESAIRPLKATFGLFGINASEVVVEGHNQFSDRSSEIIAEGLRETARFAAAF
ncbi:FMN-dependent NADH-azoreductase [Cohnella sp. JJ-181]|uniref:FMN-dependent NADH-azoreductase n=1 Tax=Cohnella rhizoplanae TaxID=2974897 RepID=UPI0022FFC015|nr:FMN-dependent NADH-azoreductase [Cohnella sp. JJ-181]CAI6032602.1 FMN-dependent NADH-azoreductase 4 [Cohnella sp. JJ-181]